MSLNPSKLFVVKFSVLKITAKNLEGRKWEGGGGVLFVCLTDTSEGFLFTQMEGEGGDREPRAQGRTQRGQ